MLYASRAEPEMRLPVAGHAIFEVTSRDERFRGTAQKGARGIAQARVNDPKTGLGQSYPRPVKRPHRQGVIRMI